jgi:hypothetical protein
MRGLNSNPSPRPAPPGLLIENFSGWQCNRRDHQVTRRSPFLPTVRLWLVRTCRLQGTVETTKFASSVPLFPWPISDKVHPKRDIRPRRTFVSSRSTGSQSFVCQRIGRANQVPALRVPPAPRSLSASHKSRTRVVLARSTRQDTTRNMFRTGKLRTAPEKPGVDSSVSWATQAFLGCQRLFSRSVA